MNKQYMEIRFELLNADGFGLSNIVNCIFELNNIVDPEYNKVEFYCSKDYWKNGWMKSDIIKIYKCKQISDIQIDYSC